MGTKHKLLLSPLQGFTDYRFRNAFCQFFGGIDWFYSPYIRLNGIFEVKNAYRKDILPENNLSHTVIPQVITNDAEEFLFVAKYVKALGYDELNWNLGCPYPMVAKRGMGSGLLQSPDKIREILERAHDELDIDVSMKMRMGYEDSSEILKVFPVLNDFPIKSIGIHARIGKQLYKGGVDLESFERCLDQTNHKIYYNGDITTVRRFEEMKERFPSIDTWMIGRAIIADPFLPNMIKNKSERYPENRMEILSDFHDVLFNDYGSSLSGGDHILRKMYHLWEYLMMPFPDAKKALKKIKKAKNIPMYQAAVREFLSQ